MGLLSGETLLMEEDCEVGGIWCGYAAVPVGLLNPQQLTNSPRYHLHVRVTCVVPGPGKPK